MHCSVTYLRRQPLFFRIALMLTALLAVLLGHTWSFHCSTTRWMLTLVLTVGACFAFSTLGALTLGLSSALFPFVIELSKQPLPFDAAGAAGQLTLYVGVIAGVTVLTQTGLERVMLYRHLAEGGGENGFALNLSGRFLWVSSSAATLLRKAGKELDGRSFFELSGPPHREELFEFFLSALRSDGEVRSLVALGEEGGEPVSALLRLRLAEGLNRSYVIGSISPIGGAEIDLFRDALDSLQTAVTLRTPTGGLLWRNAAHARLMAGGAGAELEAAEGEHHGLEVHLEDGRVLRRESYPVRDTTSGTVLAQVSLTREVTVERVAEVKLERMQRLITAGQMAAGIAHNLNNVLGAIAVNADLMLAASPEEMPRLAREINHGVQRGSDVLNRLYHLSSVSQSPRRETLSVVNLFNHVVRLIGPQAEQRGVVVRVIAPEEVRVIADAGLLHQVLLNLVLNSLQAMPDGGYLTLSAHSDGPGRSLLIVADTGPGIPPEHLSQVFTPFFTTKEDAGGTGLGLATSRTMVCAMGGDIRLESAPGMGTKAYLGFPAPTRGLS